MHACQLIDWVESLNEAEEFGSFGQAIKDDMPSAYILSKVTNEGGKIPSNQVFGVVADLDVIWEVETLLPVDNLPVDVLSVVRTERRPAYETLEHDCPE